MDSEMRNANPPPSPFLTSHDHHEPSHTCDGCGQHRTPSPDHSSHGQKWPQSGNSDHDRYHCRGWVFKLQSGVIAHPGDLNDVRVDLNTMSMNWRMPTSRSERTLSWQTIAWLRNVCRLHVLMRPLKSLEHQVADLQRELLAARAPCGFPDRGFASFPQWGRGRGGYPSNFPSQRPQDGQSNVAGGPSTSREQPTSSCGQVQVATQGQEVRLLETEVQSSASGLLRKEPSSHPKPTKIIQQHTAECSEDEPNTDDVESDWSPATAMRLIGDSVVLTVDKMEFTFSGEATKKATVAYQKCHMPPVSLRVRHWGNSASPLMVSDVDRLFANVQRYGQMLATASELGKNLSDAQAYGLAHWRGLSGHNPIMGPSMRPDQVPGVPTPPTMAKVIASGRTGPAPGARAPKVYDRHHMGVLVYKDGTHSMCAMRGSMLMSRMQPSGSTSASHQHFIQQSALLLMLPGQYHAITERFDISISAMRAGVTWSEADDTCLYGRMLAHHLLTGDTPLPEVIHQGLQEYEICICSAELATWVGPALVEAFAVPSGTVVPPGEANSTHTVHIPSSQDQDQDMEGLSASSEPGMTGPRLGDTTTILVLPIVIPMDVELGELPSASEPTPGGCKGHIGVLLFLVVYHSLYPHCRVCTSSSYLSDLFTLGKTSHT
ncbi:hypothetical protein BU15DRAFT_62596 [Melanogaster broomeanus]|nr:hypothetical protein BU15DRAFT_62596 [Melanogaster broomeanus]